MSNYENTVNWDYYQNLCDTRSSTIDLVLNAQKNPSATIQGLLKEEQQLKDPIQFMIKQFNKWLKEILEMKEDSEDFAHIPENMNSTDFIENLVALIENFSLPQLAMFLELYFPSGYQVNYQGLQDLNDALAAIAVGHRNTFEKAIQEIGSYESLSISKEANDRVNQIFDEYKKWAAPRIFHICLFFPQLIELKIEEHQKKGMEIVGKHSTGDSDEKKLKNHIEGSLFLFEASMMRIQLINSRKLQKTICNLDAFFEVRPETYLRIETTKRLSTKWWDIKKSLYNTPKYLELVKQGKITTQQQSEDFFSEELVQMEKIMGIKSKLENNQITDSKLEHIAKEYDVSFEVLKPVDKTRWIIWNWLDYLQTLEAFKGKGESNMSIYKAKESLSNMGLDEMRETALKFGVPFPEI